MCSDEMSVFFRSDRVDRESGRSAQVDVHAYLWRRRQCALNSRVWSEQWCSVRVS